MTRAIPPVLPVSGHAAAADRVAALDGVRGLAILLVVVMHSTLFGCRLPGVEPLGDDHVLVSLALLGWCGVDVFFVLSGFLITGILLRSKEQPHYFRNFYARRALRIFPLYYAVIVLLLFVLPRAPTTTAEKLSYLLYYQNLSFAFVGPDPDLARLVTWSLAIEEQFYLVWPAIVFFASRRALVVLCAIAIAVAWTLRFVAVAQGFEHTHFVTPCRMDALAAGALLALVPLPSRWFGGFLTLLGAASLVAIAFTIGNPLPEDMSMQRWGLLGALSLAVGVLVLARGAGASSRLFSTRVLRSLGQYSYCIYLTHLLVIQLIAWWIDRPQMSDARAWVAANCPGPLVLGCFTIGCLLAAWLVGLVSWHLFEKHFLACKRFFGGTAAKA
ncbi:MAG TPA: acyltransferase [Planctomycetota bacterium]